MSDDAVKVYCDMEEGGQTCVFPDVHASKMPNIPWRKSGNGWYSNLRGGFKITYDSVGPIQMTFLRLLSKEAHQNMTYTCINSAAWYDSESRNYDKAIKLLGHNDDEFSATNNKPLVEVDGCKVRRKNGLRIKGQNVTYFLFLFQWRKSESKTVFNIQTKKRNQLPIVDFYPVDYGLPHQAFGFEVGPVCFR